MGEKDLSQGGGGGGDAAPRLLGSEIERSLIYKNMVNQTTRDGVLQFPIWRRHPVCKIRFISGTPSHLR